MKNKHIDYDKEIEKCNYIIFKTKSRKCKKDFGKRKQRLIEEKKRMQKQ